MKALPLLLALTGCAAPFYRETDGTSTVLGVSLPDEQYVQIDALSYLGGSRTQVREPSKIRHEYESSSTNSYFGLVRTSETRRGLIEVEPSAQEAP